MRRRWDANGLRVALATCMAMALVACAKPPPRDANGEEAPRPGRIAALREVGSPSRIVVITVAGLEASDFLASDGYLAGASDRPRMPHLARLASEGVAGDRALPPSPGSSYASHATIVTGRLPSHHGVIADSRLDADGKGSTPFWDSQMLKGAALWDAAIGRGVMALGWPTTLGARIELLLPEARSTDSGKSWLDFMHGVSSPVVMRELAKIAADTLAADSKVMGRARNPLSWPTPSERDAALAKVACEVTLLARDPGLWLIRFTQTQVALQTAGRGSPEAAVALGRVDDAIGSIVECLEQTGQLAETAIFVVGDVAYRSVHTRVDPNVALVKAGLIGGDPRSPIGVRSWLAVSRSQGRSAYVYAKDAENAVTARKILEKEAKRTGAFRVVPAAELSKYDVDPQAWFGLAATPGFEIGNGLRRPMLRPSLVMAAPGALRTMGNNSDAVGFVAWGRGIRQGVRVTQLELVDIAPTIAMLVGLRLEEPLDGEPIVGMLRAAIPPPPPGPKRIGVDSEGDVNRTLREMGGGR